MIMNSRGGRAESKSSLGPSIQTSMFLPFLGDVVNGSAVVGSAATGPPVGSSVRPPGLAASAFYIEAPKPNHHHAARVAPAATATAVTTPTNDSCVTPQLLSTASPTTTAAPPPSSPAFNEEVKTRTWIKKRRKPRSRSDL